MIVQKGTDVMISNIMFYSIYLLVQHILLLVLGRWKTYSYCYNTMQISIYRVARVPLLYTMQQQ